MTRTHLSKAAPMAAEEPGRVTSGVTRIVDHCPTCGGPFRHAAGVPDAALCPRCGVWHSIHVQYPAEEATDGP